MSDRSRFWLARVTLLLLVAAGAATLARLDLSRRISSDVLDLIPAGEREPELAVVRTLAGERSARVALFALAVPEGAARRAEAATVFAETLRKSPALSEVVPMADAAPRDKLGRQVFAQRFDLLLPGWLVERRREYAAAATAEPWPDWLAARVGTRLEEFLPRPEALALQDVLPADPLLLLADLIDAMPAPPAAADGPGAPVLIWTRTRGSPLSEAGQQPVFAAVDAALQAARAVEPGAQLQWTAVSRFAALSRQRIQQELSGLNLLSLAAVFAIGVIGLRRLYDSLHLVPVILGGLLGAWAVTLAAFDRVHVLVFVVGSLLAGVAVDYGFYLCLQPPAFAEEPYGSRVRRLLKPLLASALTTILGFSLLLWSDLPLIRQLGVFVSAGLLCSLATALLWFAQVPQPFVATRALIRARSPQTPASRRVALALLGGAAVVAVFGPWRLHWHDDIRDLEIPAPQLRAEAAVVRAQFGDEPTRATYLTHGVDVRSARERLAEFQRWHAQQLPDKPLASLGFVVPRGADYDALPAALAGLEGFPAAVLRELTKRGFAAAAFQPFVRDWAAWRARPRPTYDAVAGQLVAALSGPLAMSVSLSPGRCMFLSSAAPAPVLEPPAALATVSARQLENLNRLFLRYRASALQLSLLGLAALGLSVLALYGVREGWRIFAVPAGSCLFAFGVLGWSGHTLNLFHLLGAFLGVCLSHNYAIFSAENARRKEESPPSVRLSALTTAASFGVLALSHIPVVAALGETVALIVLAALAFVELLPLTRRGRGAHPLPSA
jgi:predicted exporter